MNFANFLKFKIGTIYHTDRYALCMLKSVLINNIAKANLTSASRVIVSSTEKDRFDSRPTSIRSNSCATKNVNTSYHSNHLIVKPSGIFNCEKLFTKSAVSDEKATESNLTSHGRPTENQLDELFESLSKCLPRLFAPGVIPTNLMHPNVILVNNIRGTRTVGMTQYFFQLTKLKVWAYIRFAYVKFHVLKITKHPEEGTIKCRWKIVGMGAFYAFFSIRNKGSIMESAPTWVEGFSTYYIGSDGLIYKHVIDNKMLDDDKVNIDKSNSTSKMTLFSGLLPSQQEYILTNGLFKYIRTNNSI